MIKKHRSTAFNITTTLITKFISLFGGIIVSILLARFLGSEGKGIITAIFVVPLLLVSLADMGIRQSTAYYLGKKQFKISDMISSIAFLWLITSVISILLAIAYYSFGVSDKYSWSILIIAMTSIPLKLIQQYSKGIMLGKNRIGTINLAQLISVGTNIITVLLLVWIFDLGVLGAAFVQIVMALAVAIYYLINVYKYHKIRFKPISPIPKMLFYKGFSFAATLFIISLNYKIDIMILERMVTSAEIGIYSVGTNVIELLWQIPAAVGMVLFAKSATTEKQTESVKRSTSILRLVMPIMVVLSVVLAIFAPVIIRILYGTEFIEAGSILRILLPGACLITVSKVLHPDLAARGYPLFALRVFILTLIINVVLNLVLIPQYGIYGAAFASTVSYSLAGIGYSIVYSRKEKVALKTIFLIQSSDVLLIKNFIKRIRGVLKRDN